MISDISVKQETIIEAAIRRFSHFGVNKTTLSEIARDLNISKTLLFYYFDDKESLIIAVFERLVQDFLQTYRERLSGISSAQEGVLIYIDEKQKSFQKNMQLAIQAGSLQINRSSPKILKVIARAQTETATIMSELLDEEIEKGNLKPIDTRKVARIILETIQSYEACMGTDSLIPSEKELQQLAAKQKEVVKLFFTGLKN